jgi:hypothetical protein
LSWLAGSTTQPTEATDFPITPEPFLIHIVGLVRWNLVFLYLTLKIGEVGLIFQIGISLMA